MPENTMKFSESRKHQLQERRMADSNVLPI